MSFSLLAPARTILMISDDALFIYSIGSKGLKIVEAVPWTAENFEENVALIISKDCGRRPVLIVNDMVEQHYRKEKVPKVGFMDKQNVVQRKLKVAFSSYPVRAALPLKEKVSKTDKSLAASIYIFAAVPATEPFTKTMNAATRSLASIVGFCLLPIESSDMIKKLSDKVVAKADRKAKWTIFIGQHQSGGLRQIVVKNGELALTRMTPITETDDNPAVWAGDVQQEFQSTMSYLTRFGFDPSDGLNVILIANAAAGDIVGETIDAKCNFYTLTADEAAKMLRLPAFNHDVAHYADSLHISWIGRKSSFILPMKAKQIDTVSKPRQLAMLASVILFISAAFISYQCLGYFQVVTELKDEVETKVRRQAQLQEQLQNEIKRKNELGYDIELIQNSLSIYADFESQKIEVLRLLRDLGYALGRSMRIDRFDLQNGSGAEVARSLRFIRDAQERVLYDLVMQLTFPSDTDAQKGNQEVRNLVERLKKALPDNDIEVTQFLEDYEYSEELVLELGEAQNKKAKQDYIAEIKIKKVVKP